MTLDETITLLKFNNKHIADLKNDDLQQIAEWLEELKEYKYNEYVICEKYNVDNALDTSLNLFISSSKEDDNS